MHSKSQLLENILKLNTKFLQNFPIGLLKQNIISWNQSESWIKIFFESVLTSEDRQWDYVAHVQVEGKLYPYML